VRRVPLPLVLLLLVSAGKAVFHVEYELTTDEFCPGARRLQLSSMLKKYELGVWRTPC
jgi:hypothetical protein